MEEKDLKFKLMSQALIDATGIRIMEVLDDPKVMDKPFVDPISSQCFSSPAVPLGDTASTSYFGSWGDVIDM